MLGTVMIYDIQLLLYIEATECVRNFIVKIVE